MTLYTDYKNRLGRNAESDECYTPVDSVSPLLPFLRRDLTYYEATSTHSGAIVTALQKGGFSVVGNEGKDFFECGPDDIYDGVVTNPPYSKKDKFIEHCYELGKPFALLLPVSAFQGKKRGKLFERLGISALVYNSRVDFTGKGSPPFGVAWFMGNGFDNEMLSKRTPSGFLWFTE